MLFPWGQEKVWPSENSRAQTAVYRFQRFPDGSITPHILSSTTLTGKNLLVSIPPQLCCAGRWDHLWALVSVIRQHRARSMGMIVPFLPYARNMYPDIGPNIDSKSPLYPFATPCFPPPKSMLAIFIESLSALGVSAFWTLDSHFSSFALKELSSTLRICPWEPPTFGKNSSIPHLYVLSSSIFWKNLLPRYGCRAIVFPDKGMYHRNISFGKQSQESGWHCPTLLPIVVLSKKRIPHGPTTNTFNTAIKIAHSPQISGHNVYRFCPERKRYTLLESESIAQGPLLMADDMVDSGQTIQQALNYLEKQGLRPQSVILYTGHLLGEKSLKPLAMHPMLKAIYVPLSTPWSLKAQKIYAKNGFHSSNSTKPSPKIEPLNSIKAPSSPQKSHKPQWHFLPVFPKLGL